MEFTLGPLTVTKDLILSRISEETLMEHYTGVPCKKGLFVSKLRPDKRATVAYYRNNKTGRLIYKDFGTDFSADFIGVVMFKYNCTFGKALQIIANDFGIIKNPKLNVNPPMIKYSNSEFKETSDAVVQVEIKDFNDYELNWWGKYGITLETLKKFQVFSCKNTFLNGNLFSLYKEKQLIFGYYGGIREGIERWRIYNPSRKSFRFVSNWKQSMLQGAHILPKSGEFIVITKSLKDVMVLYNYNIPSIAPISENCFVSEVVYNKLTKRFKYCICLYDNDLAGLNAMQRIRKAFPTVIPLWIPRNMSKDISDFYAKYGYDKTYQLIEKTKEYIRSKG